MADRIKEQALFGLPPAWDDVAPDSASGQARASWSAIRSAVRDYEAAVATAARNEELSDRGRRAARARAAAQAAERLAQAEAPLNVARRKAERLAGSLSPAVPDVQERLVQQLQAAEVRAFLLARFDDPLTREAAVRSALEAGDVATVQAAIEAPRVMNVLSAQTASVLRQELAEKADPHTAAALREATGAVQFVDDALRAARRLVEKDQAEADRAAGLDRADRGGAAELEAMAREGMQA